MLTYHQSRVSSEVSHNFLSILMTKLDRLLLSLSEVLPSEILNSSSQRYSSWSTNLKSNQSTCTSTQSRKSLSTSQHAWRAILEASCLFTSVRLAVKTRLLGTSYLNQLVNSLLHSQMILGKLWWKEWPVMMLEPKRHALSHSNTQLMVPVNQDHLFNSLMHSFKRSTPVTSFLKNMLLIQ